MKKFTVFVTLLALLLSVFALSASAAVDASTLGTPTDITADVKWITLYDLYAQQLPVVRDDAQLVLANEYDPALVGKTPSGGLRTIIISDWESKGLKSYFNNYFDLGDGIFGFDSATWANIVEAGTWDDRAQMVYNFSVPEAGTYEFVFVGCAQIKDADVDNDAKDRGFTFSIDNGQLRSVNISDTRGIFREYKYEYSGAELEEKKINTTNGVNSYYFEPTYYYGITAELSAGNHTLEFYHLFSSGTTQLTGNGSRLNYMGFYVEKYLTDAELADYKYAEITTPAETTTEKPVETTTPAPAETTTEAAKDTTPAAQDTTTAAPAKDTTTAAPAEKKGCGSLVALGLIACIMPAAVIVCRKKH